MAFLKIAAVNYINTLPFLQALEQKFPPEVLEVIPVNPAACANKFYNNEVDMALVPVGSLEHLAPYKIITDYCIGSAGPVDTVALLTNNPLNELKTIFLDTDSRTSAKLVQLLCRDYWKLSNINFLPTTEDTVDQAGHLYIGDKVKLKENQFEFKYDLGEAWTNWTGLPMVYAVWIAKPEVNNKFIGHINDSFQNAIHGLKDLNLDHVENAAYWKNYILKNIRYYLDDKALNGLIHFKNLIKSL